MNKRTPFTSSPLRNTQFQLLPNVIHSPEAQEKCLAWQSDFAANLNKQVSFEIKTNNTDCLEYQSYQNYTLDGDADYTIHLPDSAILHPQALFVFLKEIIRNAPDLIYTNEVYLEGDKAKQFIRKQNPDRYTYLSWDYFGEVVVVKKGLGAEEAKQGVVSGELKGSFLPLGLVNFTDLTASGPGQARPLHPVQPYDRTSAIQIIIPFKDQAETTIKCLKSIAKQKIKNPLEITLVNNNSSENELNKIKDFISDDINLISVDSYFNYALINNAAAKKSDAPYILFLNNDVELKNEGCLAELYKWCSQDEVGAVGGKLHYPDGSVQSAGINFLPVRPANMRGEEFFSHIVRETNAVTFAMALVKREAYVAVGGLDEFNCPNGFGDTLFCLELKKKSWRSIYTPYAEAIHYESKSRGARPEEVEWLEMVREGLPIPDFYADFVAENQPMVVQLGGVKGNKIVRKLKRLL